MLCTDQYVSHSKCCLEPCDLVFECCVLSEFKLCGCMYAEQHDCVQLCLVCVMMEVTVVSVFNILPSKTAQLNQKQIRGLALHLLSLIHI